MRKRDNQLNQTRFEKNSGRDRLGHDQNSGRDRENFWVATRGGGRDPKFFRVTIPTRSRPPTLFFNHGRTIIFLCSNHLMHTCAEIFPYLFAIFFKTLFSCKNGNSGIFLFNYKISYYYQNLNFLVQCTVYVCFGHNLKK